VNEKTQNATTGGWDNIDYTWDFIINGCLLDNEPTEFIKDNFGTLKI